MQFLPRVILSGCLASTAAAQTYIVDAANGPGTHFTEIATAVATVPDGAVLEVRAGSYLAFGIANKGLTIFCASGVTVWPSGAVLVTGTAPHQTVELRGMHKPQGDLQLTSCQGPVLLYDCDIGVSSYGGSLRANACARIQADTCTFGHPTQLPWGGVFLQGSHAVFANCTATAGLMAAAMDFRSSSVQLVDCTVGTASSWANAIRLSAADVRIVGGSVSMTSPLTAAIGGTGSARVDPGVIHGPALFGAGMQGTIVEMPAIVTAGGTLGANVTATMRGPAGDLGALLVGLPGSPLLFPGIADAFWLQPGTEAVCAFTVFAAGVPLSVTYPVPNLPAMRGSRFCWQGVSYGATNGLQASNPAITTHW